MPRRRQSERLRGQIEVLRVLAKTSNTDELKAVLVRMACVLLSGYIEKRVDEILSDYVERRSASGPVQRAALSNLPITNVNPERMAVILERFEPAWAAAFRDGLDDAHRASLAAIVATRNSIAHGDSQTMTWSTFDDHELRVVATLEQVAAIILG